MLCQGLKTSQDVPLSCTSFLLKMFSGRSQREPSSLPTSLSTSSLRGFWQSWVQQDNPDSYLSVLFWNAKKKSLPKVASFVHTTPRPSVNEYVSTNSTCVGDFKRQVIYFTDLREKVQVIELRCLFPETLALFVNCHGTTLASHDWFSQVFLCSILEFVRSGHASASFNPSITLRGQHYDPRIIDAETRSIIRPLSQATVSLTSIITSYHLGFPISSARQSTLISKVSLWLSKGQLSFGVLRLPPLTI